MEFSGKLDIKIVSGDLSQLTAGKKPKYQKRNLNTFVKLFINNIDIGETDPVYGSDT